MRISDWSSDVCSSDLLHRIDTDGVERVDLLADPHRADLRDEAGADLGRVDVAEHVREQLAQRARDLKLPRSEERRAGKECVRTCRYRWQTDNSKKNKCDHK